MSGTQAASPRPSGSGRPLRRDAELNRQRLLEAAKSVFAERGLAGVTLDDIAERAGVGVGTAYRRFPNKDAVIAALAEQRTARVSEILDHALDADDPWEGVVRYITAWLEMHAGDRGLKDMFLASAEYREVYDSAQPQLRPRLDELVARAKAADVLRPGIDVTDIVQAQLMLSALPISDAAGAVQSWQRFLPVLLDGLVNDSRRGPLPGRSLTQDELYAAVQDSYITSR